jgi:mannose-6-phosphate isomerase-like protein (cupin superfamily)
MKHVFNPPAAYSFEKVGICGKIFDTRELGSEVEFTIVETEKGHETKIKENGCIFAYYILEGNGSFEIEGETEECREGDLVFIPKGEAFRYFGKMKLLLVSAPWWSVEQEETLED